MPEVDEGLERQLDRAVQQYTSINTIFWTVFSIFAAAHAVLVSALMEGRTSDKGTDPLTGMAISVVGALAGFFWAILLGRTKTHLEMYRDLVVELELKVSTKFGMFKCSNRNLWDKHFAKSPFPAARATMMWSTGLTVVGWAGAFEYFLIRYGGVNFEPLDIVSIAICGQVLALLALGIWAIVWIQKKAQRRHDSG